jgi:hypothetical protein
VKRLAVLVTEIRTPYVKLKLIPLIYKGVKFGLSPKGKSLGLRTFENRVLRILFGFESEEIG